MKKSIFVSVLVFSAALVLVGCNSNPNEPEAGGSEKGHKYVDLGLSVKWATMNVGATTPEDYGDYFAWGEKDDAAHVNWGGSWRMPTLAEWRELYDNCTWTWTTQNGINGYKVTSNKEGYTDRFIFLPAAGGRDDNGLDDVGSDGYYWSSSLYEHYSGYAWFLYFNSYSCGLDGYYSDRNGGRSVRPVLP